MKKIWKRVLPLSLATALAVPMAACGGTDAGTVKFWAYGSTEELALYQSLVDAFNDGYGKEHGITVRKSNKPTLATYNTSFEQTANSASGADVGMVLDDYYKGWITKDYICSVQEYVDAHADMYATADYFPSVVNRYRYDTATNTSNADDPLFALPFDTQPSALYYNEAIFKAEGIKVISVDEKDMDAWNAGGVQDKLGQTKESLGINFKVPKKGFYRSVSPYDSTTGLWVNPKDNPGEVLIFNNRIAMNWDEVEDIGRYLTKEYNPDSDSVYGYYTEWWFNYGWSVGGDCLTDLTGNGDWNFSLLDPTANYIVKEGKTYTGVSGTVYAAGENLSFTDRLNVQPTDAIEAQNDGTYKVNGNVIGVRDAVKQEAAKADGALVEMPSTREAFKRYLALGTPRTTSDGELSGVGISPSPDSFSQRTRVNWFTANEIAMLAELSSFMADVSKVMPGWNAAPLAQYKIYENPTDPNNDTVIAKGAPSGHSNAKSLVLTKNSKNKDAAVQFMLWCAGEEAQKIRAGAGFIPTSEKYVGDIKFAEGSNAPQNYAVFAEAIKYQGPGDWWYMPDYLWINDWAVELNSDVRNAKKTFVEWYPNAISKTNATLKLYNQYKRA